MPLSPKEVVESRVTFKKKVLDRLYARIDASLVAGKYTFDIPDDIDRPYVDAVATVYRQAGWIVTRDEGDVIRPTLVFVQPMPPLAPELE